MLMSAVIVPDVFSPGHFADPTYHLNLEVFLHGINSNGIVLVDADNRLYERLCDAVEPLAGVGKGQTTHALFEELLKKRRGKIACFIKTTYSFHHSRPDDDVAATVAMRCEADTLLVASTEKAAQAQAAARITAVTPVSGYIESATEAERRRCCESLLSLDKMAAGEFDRVIVKATKFSKWLRFYDKQIGKGTRLKHFRKGLEKILKLWIGAAHFPKDELSVELYTVVDESSHHREPSVAYNRVKGDLVDALKKQFGVPIKLSFKRDSDSICHARHLQTQSAAILFERGFDFIGKDGSMVRAFIRIDGASVSHLQEYRQLPEYLPGS